MSCKEIKLELPGLLFGELNEEARKQVIDHMSQCADCRREWSELKATRQMLLELREETPAVPYVPTHPAPEKKVRRIPIYSILRWGLAACFLFAVMTWGNPAINYEQGRFSFSLGQPAAVKDNAEWRSELERYRQDTMLLVSQALAVSSYEQQRQNQMVLTTLTEELNRRRYNDLQMIEAGLRQADQNSRDGLAITGQLLDNFIQTNHIKGEPLQWPEK